MPFRNPLVFRASLLRFSPAALLLAGVTGCQGGAPATVTATKLPSPTHTKMAASSPSPAPAASAAPFTLPEGGVRAIYMTGWTAGHPRHFPNLIKLIDSTELNAVVIDVKDDGQISYDMDLPLVKESHAAANMYKVAQVMAVLKAHNIYPIARIACMRDTYLPKVHPEMAVQGPDGRVWHDRSHHAWLNPCDKRVWDYNVDIALDAIKHGFKEIQFDYVRFPSEGKLSNLHYAGKTKDREEYIAAFMAYARTKIKATGAYFAADVFGLTSLVKNDEGIGQKFEKVIRPVDFLCPMVYPSHYAHYEYRIPDPNKEPYKIVKLSVGDAVRRLNVAKKKDPELKCELRPWLQAFTLYHVHYGPAQLAAQIKAINEVGVHGYMLWNAGCNYIPVSGALKRKNQAAASAGTTSHSTL